jgi:serine/threonine-protein kinase
MGDAWQTQAAALGRLGRLDEAFLAVERSLQEVPACGDCSLERVLLLDAQERCAEAEREARQSVLKSGRAVAYRSLAREMFAAGRPLEAVRNTLQQAWSLIDHEGARAHWQSTDEMLLAIHKGDLSRALGLADAFDAKIAADPNLAVHVIAPRMRIALYHEMGRDLDAARAAGEFLKERDSWLTDNNRSFRNDATLLMLRAQQRAGVITPAAYVDGRREFIERWRRSTEIDPGTLWIYAWAEPAETRAEAEEALAARPDPPPPLTNYRNGDVFYAPAQLAFLVGRYDDALPGLKKGAASCNLLDEPFRVMRFHQMLGQVLEAKGDKPGACAAYRFIVDRWGAAKPKSITADFARTRSKALGCGG